MWGATRLGKADLAHHRPARNPLQPSPVRMIRLLKFCARLKFEIHPPTFEALLSCREEILKSSSARIFEELLRMLESGASRSFFHLLNQYGLLHSLSPTLSRYLEKDNLTLKLLEEIDSEIKKNPPEPIDRALLLSMLVFPLFDDHIREKAKGPLHLGQIAEEAHRAIDQIFEPFFVLPAQVEKHRLFHSHRAISPPPDG